MDFEKLLDELYALTELQYNDIELTKEQSERYMDIVNLCRKHDIEIPFGIEF